MFETLIPGSLLLPFRLTRPLRFNSSRPLDTSVRSFQRFHPAHVLLPSVSSRSCGYVLPFVQVPIQYFRWHACFIATRLFRLLLPSFGFNAPPVSYSLPFLSIPSFRSLLIPFVSSPSCRYVRPFVSPLLNSHSLLLPFVSPLTVRLLLELFRCNSFLSFITSFRSFHLSPFIRYFLPFVSNLSFHWLLPSVRLNSDMPFVTASLRFKSFMSLRPSFRFTSDATRPYPFVTSSFCGTSYSHLQPKDKWLQVAVSGCEWLHAACWWTHMAELASWKKSFLLERRFSSSLQVG